MLSLLAIMSSSWTMKISGTLFDVYRYLPASRCMLSCTDYLLYGDLVICGESTSAVTSADWMCFLFWGFNLSFIVFLLSLFAMMFLVLKLSMESPIELRFDWCTSGLIEFELSILFNWFCVSLSSLCTVSRLFCEDSTIGVSSSSSWFGACSGARLYSLK